MILIQAILPTSNAWMMPRAKRVPKGTSQTCMASWWPEMQIQLNFRWCWMDCREECIQVEKWKWRDMSRSVTFNYLTIQFTIQIQIYPIYPWFCNPANRPTLTGITSSCRCACSWRSAFTSKQTTRRRERKKGTKITRRTHQRMNSALFHTKTVQKTMTSESSTSWNENSAACEKKNLSNPRLPGKRSLYDRSVPMGMQMKLSRIGPNAKSRLWLDSNHH